MKAFGYVNPTTPQDAVAALRNAGVARPLAGGQDLLARLKDDLDQPDRLVNVKNALESSITATGGGLTIGAAAKIIEVADNAQVARLYPAVADAAARVGSPQIRNQGTVGGNLNQRPRCWYFRNEEFVCFKKGGNRCFAIAGENQYHSIFGNAGPSKIVHPSSLAVPFVAYGARFRILGPSGSREVSAADYFTLPTPETVRKENILGDDELLTHVVLPPPGDVKSGHYEVRFKESRDWPMAFATVVVAMKGNTVASARVILGAVAPIPWRSEDAERALVGKPLNEETAAAAGEAAVRSARPLTGNAYKVQITMTAVKRAILQAAGARVV
jgi:xanthine dehydrogenase YagS FAD-binding subunit